MLRKTHAIMVQVAIWDCYFQLNTWLVVWPRYEGTIDWHFNSWRMSILNGLLCSGRWDWRSMCGRGRNTYLVRKLSELPKGIWADSWDYDTYRPPVTQSSNTHAQQSTGATNLISGQTLRVLPYYMCANSEGSGETAHPRVFADHLCDKYHNLMSWLSYHLLMTLKLPLPGKHMQTSSVPMHLRWSTQLRLQTRSMMIWILLFLLYHELTNLSLLVTSMPELVQITRLAKWW